MEEDIRQRDLSHKSVEEMTREERRELRRRFEEFVSAVGKAPPPAPPRKPRVRRWNPLTDSRS